MDLVGKYILDIYKSSAEAKDVEAHLAIYDDYILIFDAWDSWSLQGKEAARIMIREWFASLGENFVKIDFEIVRASASEDLAYNSSIVIYSAISPSGEVLRWLQNRMTLVLARRNSDWRIVHQHTSGPADHRTMKVKLRVDAL